MQNVLTIAIEQARKEQKIKIHDLSKIIGIDPTTYTRKIKNHNGLTELELWRAMAHLKIRLYWVIDSEIKPLQV